MIDVFKKRRDLVFELLSDIPDIKVNLPEGALKSIYLKARFISFRMFRLTLVNQMEK